jgi:hypothetical protein
MHHLLGRMYDAEPYCSPSSHTTTPSALVAEGFV